MEKQEKAFERELHFLCTRFFDEWDISPEAMLEILESEKMFVMHIMMDREMQDEEDAED